MIQFNSSTCNHPVWPTPLVEDGVFSSMCVAFLLLKIQVTIGTWACLWVFSPMPLVSISVFIPLRGCFHCCRSVVFVEIWNSDIFSIGELWENYFLDTAGQFTYELTMVGIVYTRPVKDQTSSYPSIEKGGGQKATPLAE